MSNVDISSKVINSVLSNETTIYKNCIIKDSYFEGPGFVGDGSKIDNSKLQRYSRTGKLNHLYFAELGPHTYTGQNTVIMHSKIGSFTSISWNVSIGAPEHDLYRITTHTFLYNKYDDLLNDSIEPYDRFRDICIVGSDVWIGAGVTILRGVEIGHGAVVGANSIVTKSIPPYAIVAGNPAKVLKYRFHGSIVNKLLDIQWWELSDMFIKKHFDYFNSVPTLDKLDELKSFIQSEKGNNNV